MKIDFAVFAQLTLTLAAAACDRPPASSPIYTAEPPPEPSVQPPATLVAVGNGPSEPAPPEVANGEGRADLTQCANLSPSCEGLIEECRGLAGFGDPGAEGFSPGYRPRIAEEIATCWVANLSPPKCRAPAMGKCVRDAVLRAPIDAATTALCDSTLAECRQAGIKPTYSRDQCQHVLSAVTGRAREDAARVIGPSGEGCSLEYALPYYPFGGTW
ncbi:MAG: hypothetical protein IPI67_34210 [Myxococcales bacterium]|nr:hypothetical protein [Myxococcales bacterium]